MGEKIRIKLAKNTYGGVRGFLDLFVMGLGVSFGIGVFIILVAYLINPEKIDPGVSFLVVFFFVLTIAYFVVGRILRKARRK